ncbi:hypothetical protein BaRGS_00023514, partial [Batillaria attramentaria]
KPRRFRNVSVQDVGPTWIQLQVQLPRGLEPSVCNVMGEDAASALRIKYIVTMVSRRYSIYMAKKLDNFTRTSTFTAILGTTKRPGNISTKLAGERPQWGRGHHPQPPTPSELTLGQKRKQKTGYTVIWKVQATYNYSLHYCFATKLEEVERPNRLHCFTNMVTKHVQLKESQNTALEDVTVENVTAMTSPTFFISHGDQGRQQSSNRSQVSLCCRRSVTLTFTGYGRPAHLCIDYTAGCGEMRVSVFDKAGEGQFHGQGPSVRYNRVKVSSMVKAPVFDITGSSTPAVHERERSNGSFPEIPGTEATHEILCSGQGGE